MSEESKSRNKSKSSKSRSSRSKSSKSGSSKSYSSRSGSSSSNSISSNSKENSEDKKLVGGFISSLFEEGEEKEEVPNQSEENEKSVFVPSLSDDENINKEDGKAVNNFLDSLFSDEKPKKKITKKELKKGNEKPIIKAQKKIYNNRNNNNKLFSKSKKTNTKKNNKIYNITSQNVGYIGKRNIKSDLGANNTTNFSQHKRMKTVENNIKINPKLKDTRNKKISKEITPPSTVAKKERKTHSAQKRIIDRNDNLKHGKHLNRTLDFQNTELSEEFKAKLESDKEKKEYEERIRLMKNHISAMKRQQEDMNKKINFLKHKEANINNVKKEREKAKKAILEYNQNKKNELEEKRKQIEKQREAMNKQIKESSQKSKMEKINKYKQSQKEKLEVNNKINNNNKNKNINIISKIEKIKALRENNKNIALNRKKKLNKNYKELNEKKYEKNVEKTNMYKMEIKQLQNEEEDLINKLNQTRERLNTFNSTENIYFGVKKIRKESGNI